MSTAIVWFRRDLRLADNPALHAACAAHARVLPVCIDAPREAGTWAEGGASRWWLHHALTALDRDLRAHGAGLHVRRGDSLPTLQALLAATGADAVYWNRQYEPAAVARDTRIKSTLQAQGVQVHSTNAALWCEPWELLTGEDRPYRVFTPFWRKLRARLEPQLPLPMPALSRCMQWPGGLAPEAWEMRPRVAWDAGLAAAWKPGEQGAHELLEIFADDALGDYAHSRDLPARHGTSRLSPHLHFGEISPRQILHALHLRRGPAGAGRGLDTEPYLRELGWREFAQHLLYHFPHTPTEHFNARFDALRWAEPDETLLRRWRRGRTGIPLVDAGMRELWHTGWMHNRVRMVVASFLTKNLRQHWRHGARWFWDTLVDADLANNTLGWQWVAGTGADAAPFFRVFNPVTQARTFDPQGAYLRRWLPELRDAPTAVLHEPWQDAAWLRRSGYPAPVVDLARSRREALAAYQALGG